MRALQQDDCRVANISPAIEESFRAASEEKWHAVTDKNTKLEENESAEKHLLPGGREAEASNNQRIISFCQDVRLRRIAVF